MPGAAVSPPLSPPLSPPVSPPVSPGLAAGLLCVPGLIFFPGLFVLARRGLAAIAGCPQSRATVLAARLVSSVQAVMASTAGFIISSSCQNNVIEDRHWLAWAYPPLAVPYFVYDVYAMYLCHLCRAQVKGHAPGAPAPPRAAAAFLRQELLMVLHHLAMVLVCFPVATFRRQHTALHKLNAVALLLTFLACRVLLFPYLYWRYGRHRGLALLRVPSALPPAYNAAAAALAAPQLYWFGLICRGTWRLFRPAGTQPRPP
ncbi:ceramide synthase isoform X2 [Agelaius phoeniceus]|uniref:ceramide synthase isoform X2 n=1 Tax=Agelaius phoeniceus TaxID=39638 RepID=UPI004054D5CF